MIQPGEMKKNTKPCGVIVPMVTPVTPGGNLDEPALDKLIDFLLAAHVDGIFVLGTTGEAPSVPRHWRLRLVERTVARVGNRAMVYAGIGDTCLADSIEAGKQYLSAGTDVLVALPPVYYPLQPVELVAYFKSLLDRVGGPVILYNIPATTRVSIPPDVLEQLQGHPRLLGIKDSENDSRRLEELMARFGKRPGFSVFIGVGVLMDKGLKLGAQGIVPSVGNLVPETCVQLCLSAARGDWLEAEKHAARMVAVAGIYQNGRTLGQSLAALKAALHWRGLCGLDVLPPLLPLAKTELGGIRNRMIDLGLLN